MCVQAPLEDLEEPPAGPEISPPSPFAKMAWAVARGVFSGDLREYILEASQRSGGGQDAAAAAKVVVGPLREYISTVLTNETRDMRWDTTDAISPPMVTRALWMLVLAFPGRDRHADWSALVHRLLKRSSGGLTWCPGCARSSSSSKWAESGHAGCPARQGGVGLNGRLPAPCGICRQVQAAVEALRNAASAGAARRVGTAATQALNRLERTRWHVTSACPFGPRFDKLPILGNWLGGYLGAPTPTVTQREFWRARESLPGPREAVQHPEFLDTEVSVEVSVEDQRSAERSGQASAGPGPQAARGTPPVVPRSPSGSPPEEEDQEEEEAWGDLMALDVSETEGTGSSPLAADDAAEDSGASEDDEGAGPPAKVARVVVD